ncbi:MAG: hypothetical protein Ta2E_01200 [Mycoplasmoidaceae bacterium]|nr:MAG: hypothetical protein Ta2E_01200 [Mycoplasmoidaceae bacterium]
MDNIAYYDLIQYQNAKLNVIRGIYWDEGVIDNNNFINELLERKIKTEAIDETKNIKRQINYLHDLLLMKDKLKRVIKTRDELESFLEFNEPILFGYHKLRLDDDYHVYLKKTYDLSFVNVLYAVHIRSKTKSIMYRYFDYCDKMILRFIIVILITYW